ncbi:hypothetical protein ACCAA_650002 [Candidatus Accumulibacter aalborgensis]|uniref:Outer membrane protein assembly factor BamE domain-containing protein n=1 Tax=Candidatus Accumulibacter aalborgensis TaxID=1860102 RepID=A0A1A8XV28_9PROT|nr:hypothetical protein ACCAA_650002 [Candidatus Accumulibacter aalborgensis]
MEQGKACSASSWQEVRQVLTEEDCGKVRPGMSTDEVPYLLGQPAHQGPVLAEAGNRLGLEDEGRLGNGVVLQRPFR